MVSVTGRTDRAAIDHRHLLHGLRVEAHEQFDSDIFEEIEPIGLYEE